MTLAEIRRRLAARRETLAALTDELRNMPSGDEFRDEHATRSAEIDRLLNEAFEDGAERGLLDEIEDLERRERTAVRAEEAVARGHADPGDDRGGDAPAHLRRDDPYSFDDQRIAGSDVRARALAAVEATERLDDDSKRAVVDMLERHDTRSGALARHIVATGRPAYRSAFARMVGGEGHLLTDEERRAVSEARAMSLTDASGGYAVPFTIDPTVIPTSDVTINPMRQIASQTSIVSDTWRGITRGAASARWAGEATEANDDSFTIDRPDIPVHRADSFVPFSVEIEGDWAALEAEARAAIAEARDELEAAAFISGSGTGQPTGVLSALAAAQRVETAGGFSAEKLYELRAALPSRYRLAGARFGADLGVLQEVRQFDTAGGADLWVQLGGSEPDTLIGHPVHEFGAMHGDATTDGEDILLFGAFSRYQIVDRVGLTVELVPHLFGANGRPTGERGFFAWWRTGGDVTDANAFRALRKTAAA